MKREETTFIQLQKVIALFKQNEITYWIDGGWGVDLLMQKQTRKHRDIDINFDASQSDKVVALLLDYGYQVQCDEMPTRMELYHDELGYLDIHPFILNADGSAKQSDYNGNYFLFDADFFTTVKFEEESIACMSLKAQALFHTGYELRDKDKHDIKNIEYLQQQEKIQHFWQRFLKQNDLPSTTSYFECFHFGMQEQSANILLALVLEGKKKATASSLYAYENTMPKVNDYSIVTDFANNPKCVIQTTNVQTIPFNEMTFEICKREGEDDNLASWQEGHRRFFRSEGEMLGYVFDEEMPVIFEDFEVVYREEE